MRTVHLLIAALSLSIGATATIAGPAIDPAFGQAGIAMHAHSELGGSVSSIAMQPDGRPVIAGVDRIRTTNRNGIGTRAFVSRLRRDGTIDETLSGGTIHRDPPIKLLVQRDGKIVTGGAGIVARYHADGSLDVAFTSAAASATASFADGFAFRDFALQPDGKVVVAGTVANVAGQSGPAIDLIRFNADGGLDASFDAEGHVRFPVPASYQAFAAVVTLPKGRIGVALTTFAEGSLAATVYRVNADGTVDPSFGSDGRMSTPGEVARGLAAQPDGKMVLLSVAGAPGARTVQVTRLAERGGVDTTFGKSGVVTQTVGDEDGPYPIALQPDGRIVVATPHPVRVLGFGKDGARDTTFGDDGVLPLAGFRSVEAITVGADGSLWLAGASTEPSASTAAGRHGNPAVVKLVTTKAREGGKPRRSLPTPSRPTKLE